MNVEERRMSKFNTGLVLGVHKVAKPPRDRMVRRMTYQLEDKHISQHQLHELKLM